MGRYMVICYLKNLVENLWWWFCVLFVREVFSDRNVDRFCGFVKEKINDSLLVEIIKKFFEFGVLRIEFGGCDKGRGFL